MKIYGIQTTYQDREGVTWDYTFKMMFKNKAEAEAEIEVIKSHEAQNATLEITIYEIQVVEFDLLF